MGISKIVLDVVADILLETEDGANWDSHERFSEFIVALSVDSGLPEREVQSRLVERMLKDPKYKTLNGNVIRFEDHLHLSQVN